MWYLILYFYIYILGEFLIKQLFHSCLLDIANLALRASLAIYHLISNMRPWNNCLIYPYFQNCACCIKDLKDNKHDSLHLGRKYAWIFVLGHYLFLEAHSFPRAMLSQNCSLFGRDNVHNYDPSNLFARTRLV